MIIWNLKIYNRIIIKLKAIIDKKDFFCYLSYYLDLSLKITYFQILVFRPYAFKFFFSNCIFLKSLTKYI